MLASTSYPLLNAFWTILFIFGFVLWFWLVIAILTDLFRSHDISGFSKVLWVLAVIFLPLLGVLMYLLVHGRDMQKHADRAAQQQEDAFRQYVQNVAGDGGDPADQLNRLANLRDRGVINNEEFERQKAKVLA